MQRPKFIIELSEENVMEMIAHHYGVPLNQIDLVFGACDEEPPKFKIVVTNPDLSTIAK